MPSANNHEGPFRHENDTYEPAAVFYFHFNGKQMVAVIREQAEFDSAIGNEDSLDGYANRTTASSAAIAGAFSLFDLIPRKSST